MAGTEKKFLKTPTHLKESAHRPRPVRGKPASISWELPIASPLHSFPASNRRRLLMSGPQLSAASSVPAGYGEPILTGIRLMDYKPALARRDSRGTCLPWWCKGCLSCWNGSSFLKGCGLARGLVRVEGITTNAAIRVDSIGQSLKSRGDFAESRKNLTSSSSRNQMAYAPLRLEAAARNNFPCESGSIRGTGRGRGYPSGQRSRSLGGGFSIDCAGHEGISIVSAQLASPLAAV